MASMQIDSLLNEAQAAQRLGLRPNTMAVWRLGGRGPKFLKIGRAVRYDPAELERWLAACECSNTAQGAALQLA